MADTQANTTNTALGRFGTLPTEMRDAIYDFVGDQVVNVIENGFGLHWRVPSIILRNSELAREFFLEYNRQRNKITIIRTYFHTTGYDRWNFLNFLPTTHTSSRVILELIREPNGTSNLPVPPVALRTDTTLADLLPLLRPHRQATEIAFEVKICLRRGNTHVRTLQDALCRYLETWPSLQQYSIRIDEQHGCWSKRNADGTWPVQFFNVYPMSGQPLPIPNNGAVLSSGYRLLVEAGHTGWKEFLGSLGFPFKDQWKIDKKRRRREKVAARPRVTTLAELLDWAANEFGL